MRRSGTLSLLIALLLALVLPLKGFAAAAGVGCPNGAAHGTMTPLQHLAPADVVQAAAVHDHAIVHVSSRAAANGDEAGHPEQPLQQTDAVCAYCVSCCSAPLSAVAVEADGIPALRATEARPSTAHPPLLSRVPPTLDRPPKA